MMDPLKKLYLLVVLFYLESDLMGQMRKDNAEGRGGAVFLEATVEDQLKIPLEEKIASEN